MEASADQKLATLAPDKLARSRRERRRAAEALEKNGGDAELADLLFASAGRPEEGEIEALAEELEKLEEGDRADAALAASHAALSVRIDDQALATVSDCRICAYGGAVSPRTCV